MVNKIGEKIRDLRRKANVTQEKFADYLGITFQAVSRWESGVCYPDLELLPAIANYFNVTTDELLGVYNMNKQERLREIQAQLRENFSKGFIKENIEICRTAVNEFPNDFELLSDLAFYLGKYEETKKEAISINERILKECTDDNIRYGVIQMLAYDYDSIGEKEKAIKTACKLPSTLVTSDMLLGRIYEGEEKISQLKTNIECFCDYITSDITNYARAKHDGDMQNQIALYKKAINIYELIYENGDYGFYNTRIEALYRGMATFYMRLNEHDNALVCLEKSVEYAIAFDTMPEVFTHTSLIPFGKEFSKAKNLAKDFAYNDCYQMLHERLPDELFNPIRETERFKAITARLSQYAKKET